MSETNIGGWICLAAFLALGALSFWRIFVKAHRPGWPALVPFYNLVVLLQITGLPSWLVVILLIPGVNSLMWAYLNIRLAKAFGKTIVFGIGMLFIGIVFYPFLAFNEDKYVGP